MAQHDQVIDNAPGNVVRSDVNAALAALFSSNSGTTAPAVTTPGLTWFDTTTNTLWIRNAANNAWIDLTASIGSTVVAAVSAFATDNRLLRSDGPGRGAQASGVTLSDLDDLSGARNLDLTGNLSVAGSLSLSSMTVGSMIVQDALDGSANPGPTFNVQRLSPSIANGDYLGQLIFTGRTASSTTETYGAIRSVAENVTVGTLRGILEFCTRSGGAFSRIAQISGNSGASASLFEIGSLGNIGIGGGNGPGVSLSYSGAVIVKNTSSGVPLSLARSGAGTLVNFVDGAGAIAGQITQNNGVVTYGQFAGAHITQWATWIGTGGGDVPADDVRRGTICETVDEICEWFTGEYEFEGETFTIPQGDDRLAAGIRDGMTWKTVHKGRRMVKRRTDREVQVEEEQDVPKIVFDGASARTVMVTQMVRVFDPVPLLDADGVPVMRRINDIDDPVPVVVQKPRVRIVEDVSEVEEAFEAEVEARAVLVQGEILPRCRIASYASTRVYGAFSHYDADDKAHIADFSVVGLGAFVVLMHPSTKGKVQAGDLVIAGKDGMGIPWSMFAPPANDMPQAISAMVVAKITAAVPIDLYDDGAYSLPCVYMCG